MSYYEEHAEYEIYSDMRVRKGAYIGLRLDGVAFHTFTKDMVKPFDRDMESAMDAACKALMERLSDAHCAYVQSDEITIVFRRDTEWHDRRIEKLLTVPASLASVTVSRKLDDVGIFDSRLLVLPNISDVQVMLHERQLDCRKNAVSTTMYWHLRQKEKLTANMAARKMSPLTGRERVAYLMEALGVDRPEDVTDPHDLWGRLFTREEYTKVGYNPKLKQEEVATRTRVIRSIAPDFWPAKDSYFRETLGITYD